MKNAWEQLHPKDSYCVCQPNPLSNLDREVITCLYQPIIGCNSYSLMMNLLTETELGENPSSDVLHAELFAQLDMSLPAFYQARCRLEAIGLLKVYVKEKFDQRGFLYEIMTPLAASAFFKDSLLAAYLCEMVGNHKFSKLVERFKTKMLVDSSYTEITAQFTDVFSLKANQVEQGEKIVKEVDAYFKQSVAPPFDLSAISFDWSFFVHSLSGLHLDTDYVNEEMKQLVLSYSALYGIDEFKMKELVVNSVDYITNQIDLKRFKHLIYQAYHQTNPQKVKLAERNNVAQPTDKTAGASGSTAENKSFRQHDLAVKGYKRGQIEVILASEQTPPMLFLKAIKQQKKGFVSDAERYLIEKLKKQSNLPDSVINILIHYVLVIQGAVSLNQGLVNTIANDWAQNEIYTPEAAMQKIMTINQERQTKQKNVRSNRKGSKNQSAKKETLPEWANEAVTEEQPMSHSDQQKINEKLKQLGISQKDG